MTMSPHSRGTQAASHAMHRSTGLVFVLISLSAMHPVRSSPAIIAPAKFSFSPAFERISPDKTWLFYHFHIPKTAGRSLYRYFLKEGHPVGITPCQQVLHPTSGDLQDSDCLLFGGRDRFCPDLVTQLRQEQIDHREFRTCNLLSFESKNLTWDLTSHLTMPRVRVITMLREPVSHYVSQYMHDHSWGRVSSMEEYLSQGNDGGYNIGRNGNLIHQRLGAWQLSMAKEVLGQHTFFFGIMEYWAESLCLLAYQLDRFDRQFCNLCHLEDLEKPEEGFSTSQRFFLGSKRIGVKPNEEMSSVPMTADQLRRIQQLNEDDINLYSWAVEIFKARVRYVMLMEGVGMLCSE